MSDDADGDDNNFVDMLNQNFLVVDGDGRN
jgi:hypothetical protein